jgi:hypothetical protein
VLDSTLDSGSPGRGVSVSSAPEVRLAEPPDGDGAVGVGASP